MMMQSGSLSPRVDTRVLTRCTVLALGSVIVSACGAPSDEATTHLDALPHLLDLAEALVVPSGPRGDQLTKALGRCRKALA